MKRSKENGYQVYLTQDTIRGIMLEKVRHPGLECIIQMPGRRIGNHFYFDMVADSGINATYEYAMCEKDHIYADHLSTRIFEYYDFPREQLTVSQIHFHPEQYRRFSHGDGPANIKLAKQFGGVTNGLMWAKPEFRIQFWYIDEDGKETPVEYTVDDAKVAAAMPKKSLQKLKKLIEDNETSIRVQRPGASLIPIDRREFVSPAAGKEKRTVASMFHRVYTRAHNVKERGKMEHPSDNKIAAGIPGVTPEATSPEFGENYESLMESLRPYSVLLPEEYRNGAYEGSLRGYYILETKTFHVVLDALADIRTDTRVIGQASSNGFGQVCAPNAEPFLRVVWTEGEPAVTVLNDDCADVVVDFYSLRKEVFSRNTGILEASQMENKQAVICGVGSGGFFMGLELVKAGIGSVIVADDDVFAYHNICRHVCGIHDVGRYKVDIFKERAADINPNCKVYTFRSLIQDVDPKVLDEIIWKNSIILSCTDNRHADYISNTLADKYKIPMIAAGCGPRASTGEVFYYKPDSGMACYTCAYGEDMGVDHGNQNVRRRFYATESELEKLHFQPGMSLDIELTAIFQTKLAIDLLMENEEGYVPKLLPYIRQCTILLNYPVSKEVNPYVQLFENDKGGMRPMTWKTGPAERNVNCSHCKPK